MTYCECLFLVLKAALHYISEQNLLLVLILPFTHLVIISTLLMIIDHKYNRVNIL